jgi:hypothetical protein
MTKLDPPESELDQDARSTKTKPPLIALNDEDANEIINCQRNLSRSDFNEKMFAEQNVELMRGAFTKYVFMLRGGILRDLRAQRVLNFWSYQTSGVQAQRRSVEAVGI